MNSTEISNKIAALQADLKAVFDKHKTADGGYDMPADVLGSLEARETELKGLNDQLTKARTAERMAKVVEEYQESTKTLNRLPVEASGRKEHKVQTLGQAYFDAKVAFNAGPVEAEFRTARELGYKAVFDESAGWAPPAIRSSQVVMSPQRQLTFLDYLPSMTVNVPTYRYMYESTFTNAAAEVAEAGTYAEAALALTELNVVIRKIGVTLPFTEEQMQDIPAAEDYLTQRLTLMIRTRLETEEIGGNGTAPNILGLNGFSGIGTHARGSDNQYDAIYKGITSVRTNNFSEPNLLVIHPQDWQTLRLGQASTGQYIWDNPSVGGAQTIFGLPVCLNAGMTIGTAFVMDTAFARTLYRDGIEFEYTNSHGTEFIQGIMRVRAAIRAAVMLDRGPALCQVTGL